MFERGNYRGMKLTDQILKIVESVFEEVDNIKGGH